MNYYIIIRILRDVFLYIVFDILYRLFPFLEYNKKFPSLERYSRKFFQYFIYNISKEPIIPEKEFKKFLNQHLYLILSKYYIRFRVDFNNNEKIYYLNYNKVKKYRFTKMHLMYIKKYLLDNNYNIDCFNQELYELQFDEAFLRRIKLEKILSKI